MTRIETFGIWTDNVAKKVIDFLFTVSKQVSVKSDRNLRQFTAFPSLRYKLPEKFGVSVISKMKGTKNRMLCII